MKSFEGNDVNLSHLAWHPEVTVTIQTCHTVGDTNLQVGCVHKLHIIKNAAG